MAVDVLFLSDFVHHKYYTRSLGPYRLASELRQNGHTAQVIEFLTEYTEEQLFAIIDKFVDANTKIIGICSTFIRSHDNPKIQEKLNITSGILVKLCAYIKSISKNIQIIVGGTQALEFIEHYSFLDGAILGYADGMMIDFYNKCDNLSSLKLMKTINGKYIFDYDIKGSNFDFVHSSTKWTHNDLIFNEHEALPLEVGRGCIFKCTFCNFPLNGKKKNDFIKDPEVLYQELMYNYNTFGTTNYVLSEDTHNDSIEKLKALKEVIDRLPFKIKYSAYIRLDLIRRFPESADLLYDMGLRSAFFGIESLNYETGKSIGKGLHPDKIKETLQWLRKEKWGERVKITCSLITGLPKETVQSLRDTMDWFVNEQVADQITQFPLTIKNITSLDKTWASDIEKYPEKYGYSWPDESKPYSWVSTSEINSFSQANKLFLESQAKFADNIPSAFVLFGSLIYTPEVFGYTIDEYCNTSKLDILERMKSVDFVQARKDLFEKYYQRLMQL